MIDGMKTSGLYEDFMGLSNGISWGQRSSRNENIMDMNGNIIGNLIWNRMDTNLDEV